MSPAYSVIFLLTTSAIALPIEGAELEFATKRIERSATQRGGPLEVDYSFKNTTERSIKITNVRTSCGCTVAKIDQKEYAPGESGKISMVFTMGDRIGRQIKTLAINTTDGETMGRTQLVLVVDIDEIMQLSRTVVFWRVGTKPEPQRVKAHVVMPERWRIAGVTVDHEDLRAKVIPLEEENHYEIEIVPTSTAQVLRGEIGIVLEEIGGDGRQEMRLRARVR